MYADTTIKAEVDKPQLTTDELLTYKITVTSSDKQIGALQLPELDGFSIASQSQTSNFSFSGKGVNTSVVYTFILLPLKTGRLKIGSSSVKVGNKAYYADNIEVEVTQGKAQPQKPVTPKKIPLSGEPQITL